MGTDEVDTERANADRHPRRPCARSTRCWPPPGSPACWTSRDRCDIRVLLDGLDVVDPGLVDVVEWPDPPSPRGARTGGYALDATVPGP